MSVPNTGRVVQLSSQLSSCKTIVELEGGGGLSQEYLTLSRTISNWGHIIFPNRHFVQSSFCRNSILPNRCFTETKIAESHLSAASHGRSVELAKLHDAERHYSESLFSRTSFFRIVVQPNIIFPNRRLAECHFYESSFSRMLFSRIVICPNVIFPNRPIVYTFFQCACRRSDIKLICIDVLRLASKICVISN